MNRRKETKEIRKRLRRIIAAAAMGVVSLAVSSPAQTLSGAEILKKVDANQSAGNKIIVSEMIIHSRRQSRSIKSKSWIRGVRESFTEFLEPAREKGTKMLKLGDELWTYTPSTDRTIKIAGHMLRQSVMGSDLSYEDMMEDPALNNLYDAKVAGEDSFLERRCWILELAARKEGLAYFARKIWVDQERFVVLKEELYARSGKLLKSLEVQNVARIGSRWIADRAIFRDAMKSGWGTEFKIESIEFDAAIPDHVFSKAALRR